MIPSRNALLFILSPPLPDSLDGSTDFIDAGIRDPKIAPPPPDDDLATLDAVIIGPAGDDKPPPPGLCEGPVDLVVGGAAVPGFHTGKSQGDQRIKKPQNVGPIAADEGGMSQDGDAAGPAHEIDRLSGGEKALGDVAGDEILLESLLRRAHIPLFLKGHGDMRAPHGSSGQFQNALEGNKGLSLPPQFLVHPGHDLFVARFPELLKILKSLPQFRMVMVEAVTKKVNIFQALPDDRQFHPRQDLDAEFFSGRKGGIDAVDIVMIAKRYRGQPDPRGHAHHFGRGMHPVGTGAVQMKVHVSHDDIMTQEEYERGEGAWNVSIAEKKTGRTGGESASQIANMRGKLARAAGSVNS